MRDGSVDRDGFFDVVGSIVRAAAATGRPVRAYGEMVALLWDAGDVVAAIDLETLWNELSTEVGFALYCAYRSDSVFGHEHADAVERVCHLHSAAEETWHFAPDETAPGEARRLVADALGRTVHDPARLDDARIVVAELAANAVLHARSPFSVSLRSDGSTIRILVRDRSHVTPVMRGSGLTTPSGRGMHLVAAVAGAWGVELAPDGKVVWAELRPASAL
jgi:anti-sigma regulatory factor (Ser/Thr protein kinase)